jgi:hypothetical protein
MYLFAIVLGVLPAVVLAALKLTHIWFLTLTFCFLRLKPEWADIGFAFMVALDLWFIFFGGCGFAIIAFPIPLMICCCITSELETASTEKWNSYEATWVKYFSRFDRNGTSFKDFKEDVKFDGLKKRFDKDDWTDQEFEDLLEETIAERDRLSQEAAAKEVALIALLDHLLGGVGALGLETKDFAAKKVPYKKVAAEKVVAKEAAGEDGWEDLL